MSPLLFAYIFILQYSFTFGCIPTRSREFKIHGNSNFSDGNLINPGKTASQFWRHPHKGSSRYSSSASHLFHFLTIKSLYSLRSRTYLYIFWTRNGRNSSTTPPGPSLLYYSNPNGPFLDWKRKFVPIITRSWLLFPHFTL